MGDHPKQPQRALLIGAGAVGQAYGYHLGKGGVEVTYFVKQKYAQTLGNGLRVQCLNRKKGEQFFDEFDVVTAFEDIAVGYFDQIWFCVDSTALTDALLQSVHRFAKGATIVTLQPGLDDFERVCYAFGADTVVRGLITLVSFDRSLLDTASLPCMCWWFPPFSRALFSGSEVRALKIVDCLKTGGMPSKLDRQLDRALKLGSGILMPFIASLEISGWRIEQLVRSDGLNGAVRAARQMIRISLAGQARWTTMFLTQVWVLRALAFWAPRFTPFDLERVLEIHFRKVGGQTRAMLRRYVHQGKAERLPTDGIEALAEVLDLRDSSPIEVKMPSET